MGQLRNSIQALIVIGPGVILSPIFVDGLEDLDEDDGTTGHLLVGTKALNRRAGAALRRRREPLHDQFWHLVPRESLRFSILVPKESLRFHKILN